MRGGRSLRRLPPAPRSIGYRGTVGTETAVRFASIDVRTLFFFKKNIKQPPCERLFATKGCVTKTLAGKWCSAPELPAPGDAALALDRLRRAFFFVGIFERWVGQLSPSLTLSFFTHTLSVPLCVFFWETGDFSLRSLAFLVWQAETVAALHRLYGLTFGKPPLGALNTSMNDVNLGFVDVAP